MRHGCNEHEMRRARRMARMAAQGWGAGFGPQGPFGPEGLFGSEGPFGGRGGRPGGRGGRGGPGGRFGGRGGRQRMFAGGELRLVLLKLVADEPRHGYDLIKAIEELTGGEYAPSPGVVYPTLQMMLDEGVLADLPDDSARKIVTVTDAGRAELAEQEQVVDRILERLSALGEERRSSPHRQIQRAMENVRNSLRYHRDNGELDTELVEKIIDVLDEAARRIERL